MLMLMMAGITFLAIHLLVSGTGVRDGITGFLGSAIRHRLPAIKEN